MKRAFLSFLIMIILMLGSFGGFGLELEMLDVKAGEASAVSGNCGVSGNNVVWNYDADTYTLTISGKGAMADYTNVELPYEKYCHVVQKIIIEEGITSIGNFAFYNMEEEEVILPSTLRTIGIYAFHANKDLMYINLPENLERIGAYAFWNSFDTSCPNLTIPGSVETIEEYCFHGVYLNRLVMKEGVKNLGRGAFFSGNISRVYCPSTLESISDDAFDDMSSDVVFYGKNEITKEYMKYCAYTYIDAQQTIPISEMEYREEYEGNKIYDKRDEMKLLLQEGFDYVVSQDVSGCLVYTGIGVYGGSVTRLKNAIGTKNMGNNVLWNYDEKSQILTISGNGDMTDYYDLDIAPWYERRREIKEIHIEEGITHVGDYAFLGLYWVEKLDLPSSLKTIGKNAFESLGCSEVTLPEGVEEIGEWAFSGAKVVKLTLPSTIKEIPCAAFHGCYELREVIMKEGITSIGQRAFEDCGPLLKYDEYLHVYLPASLEEIDTTAFGSLSFESGHVCFYGENITAEEYALAKKFVYVDANVNYNMIENVDVSASGAGEDRIYVYQGSAIEPILNVSYIHENGKTQLREGSEYTISYTNADKPGIATATISGNGIYEGTYTWEYSIVNDLSRATITIEPTVFIYDGTEKEPAVVVTYLGKELENGVDYTLTYSNNTNEGMATVKVTGIGNTIGEKSTTFNIKKQDLSDASITLSERMFIYDKIEKKPAVTVKYGDAILREGRDYQLTYANNKEVGTAIVTVTGIVENGYSGSQVVKFTIVKKSIADAEVSLSETVYVYDGTEKKPSITVKYGGKILTENKDYRLVYDEVVSAGESIILVNGIDLYGGTKQVTYEISPLSIENAEISLKETIYSYDGSPKKPSVVVKLGEKTLVENIDYMLTYRDNIDDGTGHVVVTGKGNYTDSIEMSFVILPYNAGMDAVYEAGALIDENAVYGILDDETNEVEYCCPSIKKISKVQIPATVECDGVKYKVTSIGEKAFYKNTKITSLTIGNNVTSIENYAFYGCKNLKTIKIGKRVEIIGDSAFRKCTNLTSITLPKALDQLGKNCFYGCKKLKSITINANSVVDISSKAFKGISQKAVFKVPSKKLVKKYQKEMSSKTGFKKTMKIKKK